MFGYFQHGRGRRWGQVFSVGGDEIHRPQELDPNSTVHVQNESEPEKTHDRKLRCRKWPRFTFTAGRWITSSRRCRRFGTAESTSTKGIFPVSVRFGFRDVAEVDVSKLQYRQRKTQRSGGANDH
uniref:(northern house mosquito) hypothetical protein n=1 Tax=Culex pipiens TaxID=7175 RepID=A0A8D8HQ13_CULPI